MRKKSLLGCILHFSKINIQNLKVSNVNGDKYAHSCKSDDEPELFVTKNLLNQVISGGNIIVYQHTKFDNSKYLLLKPHGDYNKFLDFKRFLPFFYYNKI